MPRKKLTTAQKVAVALALLAPGGVFVALVNGWFGSTSGGRNDSNDSTPPPLATPAPSPPTQPKREVVVIDSVTRRNEIAALAKLLRGGLQPPVDEEPVHHDDWLHQCTQLAQEHPVVVVVHWHALRQQDEPQERAEEDLLIGLLQMHHASPSTRFVFYSRAFGKQTDDDSWRDIRRAVTRIAEADSSRRTQYERLLTQTSIVSWPDATDNKTKGNFIAKVRESLQP